MLLRSVVTDAENHVTTTPYYPDGKVWKGGGFDGPPSNYTHQESDFGGLFKFLWDCSRSIW